MSSSEGTSEGGLRDAESMSSSELAGLEEGGLESSDNDHGDGGLRVWMVAIDSASESSGHGGWSKHTHGEVVLFPDRTSALAGAHQEAIENSWGKKGPVPFSPHGWYELGNTTIVVRSVLAGRSGVSVASWYATESEEY